MDKRFIVLVGLILLIMGIISLIMTIGGTGYIPGGVAPVLTILSITDVLAGIILILGGIKSE